MDYVFLLVAAVCFIVFSKFYYSIRPYITWGSNEPIFVWFPKYNVKFDQPLSDITTSLENIGFVQSNDSSGTYTRGKIYGEFSAKHVLLQVELSEDKKSFCLYAKTFILFDTGDLWRVCNEVVSGKNP